MKKVIFIVISLVSLLLIVGQHMPAKAWYGAGSTTGWDPAYDGLTGRIVASFYQPAAASYLPNQNINVNFEIENPDINLNDINKPIYLKVFHITNSPASHPLSADEVVSESDLFSNNSSGDDFQTQVQAIPVGNLVVNHGQTVNVSTNFSIATEGYYQFDLTDLGPSDPYSPGHIYAAGFVRIKNQTNNLNGGSVLSSSNGGNGPTVCTDIAPTSAPILTSVVVNNANSVTLNWTPAADPVSYYLIAYGTKPGIYTFGNPNVGGKGTTSYTVNGLSGGVKYYFVVRAGNGCRPGPFSNEKNITTTGTGIAGFATGFVPGVLGTETDTSGLNTSSEILGNDNSVTEINTCVNCIWWQILLGEFVLLSLMYRFFHKRKSKRWNLTAGLVIFITSLLVFWFMNRNCISTFWGCKFFWVLGLAIYLITSYVTYSLLKRRKLKKSKQTKKVKNKKRKI